MLIPPPPHPIPPPSLAPLAPLAPPLVSYLPRCTLYRSITGSDSPDLALLTSVLVVLFAIAKAGADSVGAAPRRSGAPPAGAELMLGNIPAELDALAEGGAWGAVYDTLKGPCMARAEELQSGGGAGGGKKGETAVSADLATCLDNMARCAEVCERGRVRKADARAGGARGGGVTVIWWARFTSFVAKPTKGREGTFRQQ